VLFSAGLMSSSLTARTRKTNRETKSWGTLIRPLGGWLAVMAAIALLGRTWMP
jgi:hypothetical protein